MTNLSIDPDLYLRAPVTVRSLSALVIVRDLRTPRQRLALPTGSTTMGIPMIWTDCTASTAITTPGGYVGLTGGITFTLSVSARGGTIRVKALAVPLTVVDAAGAPFDVGSTKFTLSIIDEAVTFTWSAGDSSWLVN